MAFDGLTTYAVVCEFANHLLNGKVDKIFEPNPNEIVLGIYSNGVKYAFDIVTSPNFYRMCLTTSTKPNPTFAPNFCMVLRKHLLNTHITKIENSSLERVLSIQFEGHSKSDDTNAKKLVVELMGKHSNIILINSKNVIIDALKHFTIEGNSYRNIIPGALYTLPISSKIDFMQISDSDMFFQKTVEFMKEHLNFPDTSSSLKLSDVIVNAFTGISKNSILSIIKELQIEDTFNETSMKQVYEFLNDFIKNPIHFAIESFGQNDYSIHRSFAKTNHFQINSFIDNYYVQKESLEGFTTYRSNLSKLILNYLKKLNHKLYNINAKLHECQNTDLYQLYGELITNNLYRIPKEHTDKIVIENYYDNNNLITIELDKTVSPAMNAKRFFKKYHKLKNAKQIVELQKQEVESEINYLESIIYEFELATTISDIDNIYYEFSENFLNKNETLFEHKKKKEKKKSKISKKARESASKIGTPIECEVDGFKVIIGKNNRQNDYITKHANSNDIWFHTKDIHGSHVILKVEQQLPHQDTINKVASLAAFYSKGAGSSNVPVDYTLAKYVKKPSSAKPGMVIYTNYKNVIVKPIHIDERRK